jgi:hypothetical protein
MAEYVRSLPGFDLPDDDRQHGVSNYHVPSLKKNVSSSVRRGRRELSVSHATWSMNSMMMYHLWSS